jgi:hypothetical protein
MSTDATHLRLLSGGAGAAQPASGLGAALGNPQPPAPACRRGAGRPWDETTAWWLPEGAAARRCAQEAAERGLPIDLVAAVLIERGVASIELGAVDARIVGELDRRAAQSRPTGAVGGPAAAYLRQLSGATPRARAASALAPVSLPGRVAARITDVEDDAIAAMLQGHLDGALAWERAAVLEGRTIAEWSAWHALTLIAAR